MRIYSMTATFGKLEHQTLTLTPGLNILEAPNEWGKSTWCAFLMAMLYGLDTRAKTTKNALADKDRYAPWSGAPMEGRIELNWNGRDITIERRSTRRIPMGEFKAYETDSGLPVTELTAANCGAVLLGVERSVFRRAGFIRHADLPVTQDEAFRRRLNALVTTGDENGAADKLAETLKDLKNKCRYNRSGLLPEAEMEASLLESKIAELNTLESQCRELDHRIGEVKNWIGQLSNHRQTMEYEQAQETVRRAAQARDALDAAQEAVKIQAERCAGLPALEEVRRLQQDVRSLRDAWMAFEMEQKHMPQEPVKPEPPAPFAGRSPEEAKAEAEQDICLYEQITETAIPGVLILMGVFGIAACGVLVFLKAYLFAAIAGVTALGAFVWGILEKRSIKKKTVNLENKYGSKDFRHWADALEAHIRALAAYDTAMDSYRHDCEKLDAKQAYLMQRREKLCGGREPDAVLEDWNQAVEAWNDYAVAKREAVQAQSHFETLKSLVKVVPKPTEPDHLTNSPQDTEKLLTECAAEQHRLQNRLGQYQGRMEALGNKDEMLRQLSKKHKRIQHLEQNYSALVIAQETLAQARAELQRRFAPRITRRAQALLSRMTNGRYRTVTMDVDMGLQVRTEEEDTLHDAIWRSDGTVDQLYLALRLAIAEELTPDVPLILDDALVRFDDARMRSAVAVLEEMAQKKQVILFTCQGREKLV